MQPRPDPELARLRNVIQEFINKKCAQTNVTEQEKKQFVDQLVADLSRHKGRMAVFLTLSPEKQNDALVNIILVQQNPKLKNIKDRLYDVLLTPEKDRDLQPALLSLMKDKLKPTPGSTKDKKDDKVEELNKNPADFKKNNKLQSYLVEVTEDGKPELAGMMIGGVFIPLAITGVASNIDVEESPEFTKDENTEEYTSRHSPFKTKMVPPGSGTG